MNQNTEGGNTVTNSLNRIAGYQSLLPVFDGNSNAEFFFKTLDEIANIGGLSPEEKLIVAKSKLRDNALEFLTNSVTLKNETNYDNFKKILIDYFTEKTSLASDQQQFSNCKQLPDESVKRFASRVNNSAHKFLGIQNTNSDEVKTLIDRTKLAKFLEGLKDAFKHNVLTKDPSSFEEAVRFAALKELNSNYLATNSANAVNTSQSDTKFILDVLSSQNAQFKEAIQQLSRELKAMSRQSVQQQNPSIHRTYAQRRSYPEATGNRNFEAPTFAPQYQNPPYRNQRPRFDINRRGYNKTFFFRPPVNRSRVFGNETSPNFPFHDSTPRGHFPNRPIGNYSRNSYAPNYTPKNF